MGLHRVQESAGVCYNPLSFSCACTASLPMHFTVIGHLTRDLLPTGSFILGGTASYAALTARQLGADVTILTRAHPDDITNPLLTGIEIINLGASTTTTFQNVYQDGVRIQHVRTVADPILADELPDQYASGDIFLLGPVCQEVDPDLPARLRGLVGVVPQGWLREWDDQGLVHAIPWRNAGRILPHTQALIASEDDLSGDPNSEAALVEAVPMAVITRGWRGCSVWVEGLRHDIPPRPAREIDPTGAGDIFAASFLVRLWETGDPIAAAYFANVAASFSVEAVGFAAIPDRLRIEAFLQANRLQSG